LLTGSIAGLAAITPAAGYVSPGSAALIGIVASLVCFSAVALKNTLGWDDALDVWGVHGVGGLVGTVLLGIVASRSWNPSGAEGLLHGGTSFFFKQCVAVAVSGVWAFICTYAMLWLIDRITPVRVSSSMEENGLDVGLHGESAYGR
jgi:Amt family ammonium transporter